MKKLFTLLMLMVCAIGTAWAEDVTIFSAAATKAWAVPASTSNAEITSDYATITGGKMYLTNEQDSEKELIKKQGEMAFQMTNNNTFFKVVLNKALEAGDKIDVRMQSRTDAELGIWLTKESTRPAEQPTSVLVCAKTDSQAWGSTPSYTVTEDDSICGETTIYLYRHTGKSTYFTDFTITRSTSERTAVTLSFGEETCNVNLGETFSAPVLTVAPSDAESEVVYASSNKAVATVNASTGAVEILGAGSTIISATISDSETYKDATASYKLTVIDPNIKTVTATFPFNLGNEGQTATVSVENVFSVTSVGVADMTYAGVGSDQDITGTKMQPTKSASDDKSQYTKFTVTPKKGITFVPTKISFDAMRWGTDGNNKLHYYAESGSTSVELGNVNPNRNGRGQGWSHYEHTISGINATSTSPFSLACYVYGLANTKQISFANVVIEGEYSGEAEEETMYAITTSVSPENAGSVVQNPAGASLAEGAAVTFAATANTGYKFLNKWTVNGIEVEGETYTVSSLSENLVVEAQFQKLYAVSFSAGDGDKGTAKAVLATEYVESSYTTPAKNYYISKPGATVTGWTDGTYNYGFNEVITLSNDIELSPIFTDNTKTVADATAANEVTWEFRRSKGAPFLNIENATGYYVTQKAFDGETIDLPIYINNADNAGYEGKRGKTNNTSSDAQTQVNVGSKFTLPAVSGMKININAANAFNTEDDANNDKYLTTIGGVDMSNYLTSSKKGIVYTYEGNGETVDIIFGSGFGYLLNIVVTYPAAVGSPVEVAIGSTGYATFCSKSAVDFSAADVTVYTAKVNGSKAELTEVESKKVPANTGVILKGSDTVTGAVIAEADALTNNHLIAATSDVTTTGIYILVPDGESVKFTTMTSGTLKAGKAYLPAASSARELNLVFGEATGISEMKNVNTSAEVYNLNGMRIAQPTKGLYIQNGKKLIVK